MAVDAVKWKVSQNYVYHVMYVYSIVRGKDMYIEQLVYEWKAGENYVM